MDTAKLTFVILAGTLAVAAVKPVHGTGFTCEGPNGAVKRINIDLKAKRYQEAGEAPKNIKAIDEAAVTLVHYNTVADGFFLIERLDRSSLTLTIRGARDGQIIGAEYRCTMGAPFDFADERQF